MKIHGVHEVLAQSHPGGGMGESSFHPGPGWGTLSCGPEGAGIEAEARLLPVDPIRGL